MKMKRVCILCTEIARDGSIRIQSFVTSEILVFVKGMKASGKYQSVKEDESVLMN
jgi:hypothetical protein